MGEKRKRLRTWWLVTAPGGYAYFGVFPSRRFADQFVREPEYRGCEVVEVREVRPARRKKHG